MHDYIIKRKLIVGGERRVESRKSLKCKNSVIFQQWGSRHRLRKGNLLEFISRHFTKNQTWVVFIIIEIAVYIINQYSLRQYKILLLCLNMFLGLMQCSMIILILGYDVVGRCVSDTFTSDPDPRFLKLIRIRPNDTNPTSSGSETLQIFVQFNNDDENSYFIHFMALTYLGNYIFIDRYLIISRYEYNVYYFYFSSFL